jgi:hypothetical protein
MLGIPKFVWHVTEMNEMEIKLRHAEFGLGGVSQSYVELHPCRYVGVGHKPFNLKFPKRFLLF